VRAGTLCSFSSEARRAGTNRGAPSALAQLAQIYPALTDGAINWRSFGPDSSEQELGVEILITL
jgi:hypothetical protein